MGPAITLLLEMGCRELTVGHTPDGRAEEEQNGLDSCPGPEPIVHTEPFHPEFWWKLSAQAHQENTCAWVIPPPCVPLLPLPPFLCCLDDHGIIFWVNGAQAAPPTHPSRETVFSVHVVCYGHYPMVTTLYPLTALTPDSSA